MNFDLRFYWRLFVRRLPAMLAIFIVCSAIGAVMAMRAPTTFRTEARLVVEDPQIPQDLAESTVRTNAGAAIEIIRQRLLTRNNLLDIANDLQVFEDYSAMSPDEIVARMRARDPHRQPRRSWPVARSDQPDGLLRGPHAGRSPRMWSMNTSRGS